MKNRLIRTKRALDKLDAVVLFGAGRDIKKPKRNNGWMLYLIHWIKYGFWKILDKIDTKFLFRGRTVRTKKGRVRSRCERKLVDFFEDSNIRYIYEPLLVLDGKKLHPDFYLQDYRIYVEFWGMVDSSLVYQRYMARKLKLYKKHNVPMISLYPRHLKDIRTNFPLLLKKATEQTQQRRCEG